MKPFENRRVLITGGTGSLGKVLVRRLLSGEMGLPAKVIVFSRDEAKQHFMRVEYQSGSAPTDEIIYHNFERLLEFRIGDVRDFHSVAAALRDADIVVNAAALKQVPTCEYFPYEAVRTNIEGAGEHRPGHPGASAADLDRGRRLDRQGVQARQHDGHDQGHPGAHLHPGEHALSGHTVRVRALRQRAGVARLGDPAVSRPDSPRRAGHDHDARR